MRRRCDNGIVYACPLQNVTANPSVNIIDAAQNKRQFPQCAVISCKQSSLTFVSFRDLAIRRGMTIVYHRKDIDRKFFEIIRSRLSPCCSVASLYFWAAAGEAKEKAPVGSTKKQEVKK